MLRLGIIGLSEGNGHPYSWSAIINGYAPKLMADCEFSAIPKYLNEESWPDAQLDGAKVCYIWTQDLELSKKIAAACYIDNVVADYLDMIGKVDAILLARDDAENHLLYAQPFIENNIPIYIDKPIALNLDQLNKIYQLTDDSSKIFTCSALRYSQELKLKDEYDLGIIQGIYAETPKSWSRYAVHIIEPVLNMIPNRGLLQQASQKSVAKDGARLSLLWESGVKTEFVATGESSGEIKILVEGDKNEITLVFSDSFSAFKNALGDFLFGVLEKETRSEYSYNRNVVELIEKGQA